MHMGAKTWMLIYADEDAAKALSMEPALDRDATLRLAYRLFPCESLEHESITDLWNTDPPVRQVSIGQFPGVAVVAADEFGHSRPSALPERFLRANPRRHIYLLAMHSVIDWFAYAYWRDGVLVRSLSVSPDDGFSENIGKPLAFEEPFWDGIDRDEERLPFWPLDLAEAARLALCGYRVPSYGDSAFDPAKVKLLNLVRAGPEGAGPCQMELDFAEV
jgi:hypothetical protein